MQPNRGLELFQYSLRLVMMGPGAGTALTYQYPLPVRLNARPFAVILGKVDFTTIGSAYWVIHDSISMSS